MSDTDHSTLSPSMRRHHAWMLGMSLAALLLSFCLEVRPEGTVSPRGLPGIVLPGVCLSREMFGLSCPACGLTRSFVLMAHGQWHSAWQMHRLGWFMAIVVLLQVPYRSLCLYRSRQLLIVAWARVIGYLIIAALVGNWLIGGANQRGKDTAVRQPSNDISHSDTSH